MTRKAEPIETYAGEDADDVRLAYVAEMPVNWCPALGTVLANEEVVDGKSEIGGHPVERRPMRQWMLRITAYAERLIDELDGLDWPEGIKLLQRNWIGRSEGALVKFEISRFEIRNRSLHDAARHPLWRDLHGALARAPFGERNHRTGQARRCGSLSEGSRFEIGFGTHGIDQRKDGRLYGRFAINPVNGEKIPDLDRRLCPHGLWDGRDHGRARS